MAKLVIFKIGKGDFQQGFPVTLQIGAEDTCTQTTITGKLPKAPLILAQYQNWQTGYNSLFQSFRGLKIKEAQTTNYSIFDSALEIEQNINKWLNFGEKFQRIRDQILTTFSKNSEEIRLIIQAEDPWLWRLPWHLWDLLKSNLHVEVALGYSEYKPVPLSPPKFQVRILVILGYSPDINVEKDLESLFQQLPEADIFSLSSPRKEELNNQLWEQDWNILFFAGHSDSENGEGRLYINQEESLTIADLKNSLENAIAHGLRLAIFNSCDGLGLAQDLADVQIPAIIVMRERVADIVAQKFIKFFLKAFGKDKKSLYASVRYARARLEELERDSNYPYPCASWLPVICQNPAENPLTWQDILEQQKPIGFRAVLLASMAVTLVILGMRSLGIFQLLELKVFDFFLGLRPLEQADSRILIVKVREEDLKQYIHPLPDAVLGALINKLDRYQPRAIGLDIYRDRPINYSDVPVLPGIKSFLAQAQQNPRLISICKVSSNSDNGVSHLEGIPRDNLGYSNSVEDGDRVIRRHLLWQTPPATSPCLSSYALSVLLALKYLAKEGIFPQFPHKELQLKNTVFKDLLPHAGIYQQYDDGGQQILLNYRNTSKVAPEVTLADVLENRLNSNLVKDKIILIGITAVSVGDQFTTPLGKKFGVEIHAHMASQILSSVLDQRPLLLFLPMWADIIWIEIWAIIGGLIVWKIKSTTGRGLGYIVAFISLNVLNFGLLLPGWVVPYLPAAIALSSSSIILILRPQFS